MQDQWRGYIMNQYRQNEFETDKEKIANQRRMALDAVKMYDHNLDLKYLRFLDTGVKPFIPESERIRTAAQRVGLETTNVDSAEDALANDPKPQDAALDAK